MFLSGGIKRLNMLYLVCGLPGTGKTAVAKELVSLTGGVILRTDEIRKRIFSSLQYTPEEKRHVYGAVFKTAESMLRMGMNVILDATFYKKTYRDAAGKVAERVGKKLAIIEVKCDEETVLERIGKRRGDLSDADRGVYKKIKGEWEPVTEKHHVIDISNRDWKEELKRIVE